MLPTIELQKAVYKYLTEAGLKVKDSPPPNEPLPFVQFGGFEGVSNRTKSHDAHDLMLTLHVWVVDTTGYQVHEMAEKVISLVDADLDLESNEYELNYSELDFYHTLKESYNNEIISHAIVQIKFNISQK